MTVVPYSPGLSMEAMNGVIMLPSEVPSTALLRHGAIDDIHVALPDRTVV